MIAAIVGFVAGIVVGILASIVAVIAVLNSPPPERQHPIYTAIGAGPARTSGPESTLDFIQRRLK
jgi:hypothetical protein